MLRLSIESLGYSVSVKSGKPCSTIHGTAGIAEPLEVLGSRFSGPVNFVISSDPIDAPFEHGSIFWDTDAYGDSFASVWLCTSNAIIDRIFDHSPILKHFDVDFRAALVNGGEWHNPKKSIPAAGFSCTFMREPVA